MKIAIVANARAVHTQRWASALASRGHDVYVISVRDATIPGASVIARQIGNTQGSKLHALIGYIHLAIRLKSDLRKIKPDIVNAHYCVTNGMIAALANARPRVVNVWGSDLTGNGSGKIAWWRKFLIRYSLSNANAVISTSEFMAGIVRDLVPDPPPITVIPFGVDTSVFYPEKKTGSGKLTIGFVKSFSKIYAPELFVKAAAIAALENDNLQFVMAGRGPMEIEMKELAEQLGVSEKFSFPGFIPHDRVPDLMRTLDILVNCSHAESFGVVICEASASGIPVIATDVGGVREVLKDGETGSIIPPNDVGALASAILLISANKSLRESFGTSSRALIETHFQWQKCVETAVETLHCFGKSRN